jgi:DNA-binding transcriptional ArsR family regulator
LLGSSGQGARWVRGADEASVRATCLAVLDLLPAPAERAPRLTPVRDRLAEVGAVQLVDEVAPGLHYGPGVLDDVVLVTSPQVTPIVVELAERDRTVIVHPPLGQGVRLPDLGRALGDDVRMRLLQLLKSGPRRLPELCEALDSPRTTLLHHLALLRGAGLVDLTVTAGEANVYRLRPEGFEQLAQAARAFAL